jgi:hypothetical protein
MELSKETMSEMMARQRKINHVLRLGFHSVGSLEFVSGACSFAATTSAVPCVNDDSLNASSFVISLFPYDRTPKWLWNVHRNSKVSCAMYRPKLGEKDDERNTNGRLELKIEKARQECSKIDTACGPEVHEKGNY